jgi:hypothetical protein
MSTPTATTPFAEPAPAQSLERAAAALTAHGFVVEILDNVALRISGIDEDINAGDRYKAIKPRVLTLDRVTAADQIRRLLASPDVIVGSAAAVTETSCSLGVGADFDV